MHRSTEEEPRDVAAIVDRLRSFPFEPLPLPVNLAFGRQFGADASVLLFGNQQRFSSPHRYPKPFRRIVVEGHGGAPLAANVAMQRGSAPLLVICHGLCMTMRFRAVIQLAIHAYEKWGWHVIAYDARGCGESAWLCDEQPTGGWIEGEDLVHVARQLRRDERVEAVHALGISLGGSNVLNGARVESDARRAGDAPALDSVLSVSGPTVLSDAVDHISTRPSVLDDFFILYSMFKVAIRINARRLGVDAGDVSWRHATDVWFAEHHGVDPHEFQERASAATFADRITIPTLQLHAKDDFCVPVEQAYALERAAADNPDVQVWITERGNHASFDAVARRWYRSVVRRWGEHWTRVALAERAEREAGVAS